MERSIFTSLCFIIISATFIIPSDCSKHTEIVPLFVFGDSIFDPGNNNYIPTNNFLRANFSPYGETFFKYATGRFSNGRLIPDFIAEFAKLPLIPPYLEKGQKKKWSYGVNFASGGSGALIETNAAGLELHQKGARKFGFFSLFPLGCIPYTRATKGVNGQCVEELTFLTKLYNTALAQRLHDLQKQLKGFHYSYFDSVAVAMDMIDNPSKYGFEEVKSACCGSGAFRGAFTCGGLRGIKEYELCMNPKDHLFFDSFHPTEKGYRLLAEVMWHGGGDVAWPFNLKSLFEVTIF